TTIINNISLHDALPIYYLLTEEISYKNNRAAQGIIKAANFPFRKTIDDYDFSFQPSVSENQIKELCSLSFIENKENIIFIGNSGDRKSTRLNSSHVSIS